MKKILLSTVAFAGLTAGAMAADLPMRAAPPPPVAAAVPVFTWTGFYVGVNVGWAFDGDEDDRLGSLVTPNGPTIPGRTFTVVPAAGGSFLSRRGGDDGGLLGGGQVGYNMQFGSFVVGIEADAQAIDLGDVSGTNIAQGFQRAEGRAGALPAFGIAPVAPGASNVFFARTGLLDSGDDTDVFGTVRGRLGMAFGQALIYATGGLAWKTDGDDDGDGVSATRPGAAFYVSRAALARGNRILDRINGNDGVDSNDFGFTVGGGVEYAFTNNISAKIEGLYVDFSDDDGGRGNRIVGVTNTGRRIRHTGAGGNDPLEFGLVRAGLNFRFGTW
jgi:outer membrane immunogenic protein